MKKVLFVDSDKKFLAEVKESLGIMREHWAMHFANDFARARGTMEHLGPFDMVVSDMPFQDEGGTEFMTELKETHPDTFRFVLSEPLDQKTVLNASTIVHQFLTKPIDGHKLRIRISRALALKDHIENRWLQRALLRIGVLPSVPKLYREIQVEIRFADTSVARIAELIERDPAMSSKMLQIVNSAYTGLSQSVSSVVQAATLLGLENIESFVLMAEVFSAFERSELPPHFDIDALWKHGLTVGSYAKKIAERETEDEETIDHAYTAGLLHDAGLIILAARLPTELEDAKQYSKDNNVWLAKAEKEVIGATHAEIGGYMLELWGFPYPVVEGVMFHDLPSSRPEPDYVEAPEDGFSPMTAVHMANYICQSENEHELDSMNPDPDVDAVYLELLGLSDRVTEWYDLCLR